MDPTFIFHIMVTQKELLDWNLIPSIQCLPHQVFPPKRQILLECIQNSYIIFHILMTIKQWYLYIGRSVMSSTKNTSTLSVWYDIKVQVGNQNFGYQRWFCTRLIINHSGAGIGKFQKNKLICFSLRHQDTNNMILNGISASFTPTKNNFDWRCHRSVQKSQELYICILNEFSTRLSEPRWRPNRKQWFPE